jgi:hypothetical protein
MSTLYSGVLSNTLWVIGTVIDHTIRLLPFRQLCVDSILSFLQYLRIDIIQIAVQRAD